MDASAFSRLEQGDESLDDTDLGLLMNLQNNDCVVFSGRFFSVQVNRGNDGFISLSAFPFRGNHIIYFPEFYCSYSPEQKCFLCAPFPDVSSLKAFLNGYCFVD